MFTYIGLCYAKQLPEILKKYNYQQLKLVDTNQEFVAPYLIAKVNQNKAYILFDSGSKGVSIFNSSVLNKRQDSNYSLNMAGQKSKNHSVILDEIEIGNIHLNNIKARTTTQPKKKQYPIIVIGLDFLEKYNAIFDFSRSYIYLTNRTITPKDHYLIGQKLQNNGNYLLINLTKLISQYQIMPITVNNNSPVNCLVDTGTSNFTISNNYSESLGLKSTSKKTIQATDGTLTIADANISSLIINPLNIFFQKKVKLDNISATSANIEPMSKFLGVLCVLGYKELSRMNSIYDIAAARIYIRNNHKRL
ncbi:retroviral-like aspartic protease family protein [Francisella tularensis subsp. mediasiatica]|nr:retroviral-like aspartic protease family protein [Francisella tularensis]ACD30874.1 conserved hypothetical protein [Francisella tularensis subsp. mediasiatica FSC147]MDN9003294.1 retroviral-like aspartic protease family protein [Francisella tularensis subsp. mediasiatica]MDN9006873.1 retroviral-like aspartic protease family protein [Francisella tularensis subsp. mediasiatica]WKL71482.1 retroviral-like aspartic protease family protein [Francisella tularensis subsp. mediasiatica]WKL72325.1 re